MITTLIASLALVAPQEPAAPSAGPLVSKMLARYSTAQTLAGRIVFTQAAQGKSVVIQTEVQYEKPSKLYLKQVRTDQPNNVWLVTSDGVNFSYNRPERFLGTRSRLVDPVVGRTGPQDIKDIYLAAMYSIGDKSPALDMMISRLDDLKVLKAMWGPMVVRGRTKVRDVEANLVEGTYRLGGFGGPLQGRLTMVITDDGDLLQYGQQEMVAAPGGTSAPFSLTTTWDCDVKVNATPNPSLFTVVK